MLTVRNKRSGYFTTDIENYIDNIQVYPQSPNFIANTREISAASGGTSNFDLDAGSSYQGNYYFIFSSVTGPHPGFDFGGIHVPLTLDFWTWIAVGLMPYWPGFQGQLNGSGQASATLSTFGPLDPSFVGIALYFDYIVLQYPSSGPLMASYPIYVLIIP